VELAEKSFSGHTAGTGRSAISGKYAGTTFPSTGKNAASMKCFVNKSIKIAPWSKTANTSARALAIPEAAEMQ
jgi:hypothetical protein